MPIYSILSMLISLFLKKKNCGQLHTTFNSLHEPYGAFSGKQLQDA